MKDLALSPNPFFLIFRKKYPQKFGSFENNAYFCERVTIHYEYRGTRTYC